MSSSKKGEFQVHANAAAKKPKPKPRKAQPVKVTKVSPEVLIHAAQVTREFHARGFKTVRYEIRSDGSVYIVNN